ncbi:MAG: hypothetical protein KDA75_14005, partial [Planctomycetaceae bacterium]|nr:hypothetical protein [Planctomycetaceae bacterium]
MTTSLRRLKSVVVGGVVAVVTEVDRLRGGDQGANCKAARSSGGTTRTVPSATSMIGTADHRSSSDGYPADSRYSPTGRLQTNVSPSGAGLPRGETSPPPRPVSLSDTGLTLANLADLTLKLVYLHGSLAGGEISAQLRLPFSVLEEALTFLRQVRCLEVRSGEMLGQLTYRFHLTEEGRNRAREAFEQSRYVGPAPVSLRSYVEQSRRQKVSGVRCSPELLRPAFDGLILRPDLLDELGPAICDGQALFLHGPPGNG